MSTEKINLKENFEKAFARLKAGIAKFKGLLSGGDFDDEPDKARRSLLLGAPAMALGAKVAPSAIAESSKIDLAKNAELLRQIIRSGGQDAEILIGKIASYDNLNDLRKNSKCFFDAVIRINDLNEIQKDNSLKEFTELLSRLRGSYFDMDTLAQSDFANYLEKIGFGLNNEQKTALAKLSKLSQQGSINEALRSIRKDVLEFAEKVVSDVSKNESLLLGRHGEIIPELRQFIQSNTGVLYDRLPQEEFMQINSQLKYFDSKLDFLLNGKVPNEEYLERLKDKKASFENPYSILSNHYGAVEFSAKKLATKGQVLILQSPDSQKAILVDPRKHEHFKTAFDQIRKNSAGGFVLAKSADIFTR